MDITYQGGNLKDVTFPQVCTEQGWIIKSFNAALDLCSVRFDLVACHGLWVAHVPLSRDSLQVFLKLSFDSPLMRVTGTIATLFRSFKCYLVEFSMCLLRLEVRSPAAFCWLFLSNRLGSWSPLSQDSDEWEGASTVWVVRKARLSGTMANEFQLWKRGIPACFFSSTVFAIFSHSSVFNCLLLTGTYESLHLWEVNLQSLMICTISCFLFFC